MEFKNKQLMKMTSVPIFLFTNSFDLIPLYWKSSYVQTCKIQSSSNDTSIKDDEAQLERILSSMSPINRRDAIAQ